MREAATPPALLLPSVLCTRYCVLSTQYVIAAGRQLPSPVPCPDSSCSMTPREVLALCRENDVKAVDLRFCDLLGSWQHFTIPVGKLEEGVFEDGLGFDGSSIRGWQSIHESDMLVLPQSDTAFLDPFTAMPTLALICNIQDPVTG